ncbi:MAG: dCTP deaminase [Candidatus Norongarragalinales archaeon]
MILDKTMILKEITKGELKITPFERQNVGECSVDLTLSNEFRVFKKKKKHLKITEKPFLWEEQTKKIVLKRGELLVLKPNALVLGLTGEKIKMPPYLCGWLQGRSRLARMGLLVHVSSSLIQPGVENRQVLEIANLSPSKIALKPGLKICQVIFEQITGRQKHAGVFARQTRI